MRIPIICLQCEQEHRPINMSQINNNNIYTFTCENGHENVLVHQQEKFELLFDSGARAIKHGYLREGVSSIASSLERMYEFAIKVLSLELGVTFEEIEAIWKNVSRQSERQIGAFTFLYGIKFKHVPLLINKQVEFRNEVIHKGYFPSFEETIEFGQSVLDLMSSIVSELKHECKDSVEKVIMATISKNSHEARKISENIVHLSTATAVSLNVTRTEKVILSDYITSLE